jgi:hypothetical protein
MHTVKPPTHHSGKQTICPLLYLHDSSSQVLLSAMLNQIAQTATDRSDLERLITNLSAHFICLDSEEIDQGIDQSLRIIGTQEKVDRSYVFVFQDNSGVVLITNTHEWCAENIEPQKENLSKEVTFSSW